MSVEHDYRWAKALKEAEVSWTLVKSFRPKGHAYFVDQHGNYAIADNSGNRPEDTDDGVLYIDHDRALVVEKASLPLKGGVATPIAHEEAEWVSRVFRFTPEPTYRDDDE